MRAALVLGLLFVLMLVLALAGCATCEKHPVACTVAALAVGAVVVAAERGGAQATHGECSSTGSRVHCHP